MWDETGFVYVEVWGANCGVFLGIELKEVLLDFTEDIGSSLPVGCA